jgi:hypothetical protein
VQLKIFQCEHILHADLGIIDYLYEGLDGGIESDCHEGKVKTELNPYISPLDLDWIYSASEEYGITVDKLFRRFIESSSIVSICSIPFGLIDVDASETLRNAECNDLRSIIWCHFIIGNFRFKDPTRPTMHDHHQAVLDFAFTKQAALSWSMASFMADLLDTNTSEMIQSSYVSEIGYLYPETCIGRQCLLECLQALKKAPARFQKAQLAVLMTMLHIINSSLPGNYGMPRHGVDKLEYLMNHGRAFRQDLIARDVDAGAPLEVIIENARIGDYNTKALSDIMQRVVDGSNPSYACIFGCPVNYQYEMPKSYEEFYYRFLRSS